MNGEDEFATSAVVPSVGERLRAAREARGLTVDEIAATTRIPARHLRTIEAGGYNDLPAPTYSVGFIKSWARLLGLDGQALADEFRAGLSGRASEHALPLPYEPADPRRTPPAAVALLALLIAILLALGYLYWRGTAEQPATIAAAATDQPAVAPPQGTPAGAPPAVALPAVNPVPPTGPVVIGATQDVWIKVSDANQTLYLGVLHPGEHFEVPAGATAPLLTTGRPGSTIITVGQTPIPPVGDPDRIAKDVSLKAADLMARAAAPPPTTQPPANAAAPVDNAAGPA